MNRADVALGALMAAVLAVEAVRAADLAAGAEWRYDLGVGLVICAAALLRGWNLVWAAVTGLAVFGLATALAAFLSLAPQPPLSGALLGLLVLGAAAARTLPPRAAAVIAIVGLVVIPASEVVHVDGWLSVQGRAFSTLLTATLWAGALATGVWLRYLDIRRQQTLAEVRRDERIELARELHDVVAHHVTGIVVQAQAARFTGTPAALENIETAGLDTLAAIRQLVGLLRDPEDTSGTAPVPEPIGRLVERFARHGPAVDLRLPAVSDWPPEVTTTVYRIVREALTNITRHAPGARAVTVTVTDDRQHVAVEITDDAPTAARSHGGGYGLVGMRERVEALGGQLRAGPRSGAGWVVHANLPVRS